MESLTHAEEMVLCAVWRSEKADWHSVYIHCKAEYGVDWKRTTISTFLQNLRRKGYLTLIREGRQAWYVPLVKYEEYRARRTLDFLEFWYGDPARARK